VEEFQEVKILGRELRIDHDTFVSETLIERELVECQKSIFICEQTMILHETAYLNLNYQNKFYNIPNSPLFVKYRGIAFSRNIGALRFPQVPRRVVESGIYKRLDESMLKKTL